MLEETSEITEEKNHLDNLIKSLQGTLISGTPEDKEIVISRLEDEATKYIQEQSTRDKTLRIAILAHEKEIIRSGTYRGHPIFFGVFMGDERIGSHILSNDGIDQFLLYFDQ